MAPGGETSGLRTGLGHGCCEGHLGQRRRARWQLDALGTAKVLAAAIGRASPDLVVDGDRSTDGYTGTLPGPVAELHGPAPRSPSRRRSPSTGARSRSSARPRRATTKLSARCPPSSRSPPASSSPGTPPSRGSWRPRSNEVDNLTVADLEIDAVAGRCRRCGPGVADMWDLQAACSGGDRGGRGRRRRAT